jgi:hypothetical protein
MDKFINLKLASYVGPLYVYEENGKYFLVVENPNYDSEAEISKSLYGLIVKELSVED